MFGWLLRLIGGGEVRPKAEEVEPLLFTESAAPRPAPARAAAAPVSGACIIDRYVYASRNGREDRTAHDVEYLGIVERPSDGFTCLAVRCRARRGAT